MDGGTGPLVGNGTEPFDVLAAAESVVLVALGAEEVVVGTPSAVTLVPLVEGAAGVVGAGAVVVDDEFDDVTTVALGVALLALEVAGAAGGDEADPPHAASTTGRAMMPRTFSIMRGHYCRRRWGTRCRPRTRMGVQSAAPRQHNPASAR